MRNAAIEKIARNAATPFNQCNSRDGSPYQYASQDPILSTVQAAAHIGMRPSTLTKWRMHPGMGPAWLALGSKRVGYRLSALELWLATRQRNSTLDER